MNLEEILEIRKRSAVAVFHRFRLEVRTRTPKNIFVEGFDDLMYYSRVRENGGYSDARIRLTYGKRNMDRIIQWFYAEDYVDTDTLFIRDSDFDRFLAMLPQGDKVFVTCCYAVENYVCNRQSLLKYFTENLCVDPLEVDVESMIDRFEAANGALFEWMAPLIGHIVVELRKGTVLSLDALDLSPEFKLLLSGKDLPDIFERDFATIGIALERDNEEAAVEGARFVAQDALCWIRGKQLLRNAAVFLRQSSEDLRSKLRAGEISQLKKTATQDFSDHAVFERLAPLAKGSDALRQALKAA
jgi:hypothetical protein